ncbi:MAG TPA: MmcQ/YjbR family DNA-binding protein [Bryobacteraceae bacterium]|nr:MmcQ/YjbR family DNA-binding protein [Bryobacteraceae bacterium]
MTPDGFRELAVRFPEASESAHMGHPDFRVGGKIFATLGYPTVGWAMVKLTPEQQHEFVKNEPMVFVPVKGAWGRRGCTSVLLKAAKKAAVQKALAAAWRNAAPKRLGARATT